MTVSEHMRRGYFEWLCSKVSNDARPLCMSYDRLLRQLHSIRFTYTIPMDENRASDGRDLRHRYTYASDAETFLKGPCSVLEMMVALAIRCEETIMDDPQYGDRTGHWFWGMIINLGLGAMTDERYDEQYVDETVRRFLKREYDYDGKGGLFRIKNPERDLRSVEIWWQLCWYLNTIT